MKRSAKFTKLDTHVKWGILLVIVLLLSALWGVRAVRALPDNRVDLPNPKVEPLLHSNSDVLNITDLAEGYRGPGIYRIEVAPEGQIMVVNRWCTKTQDILSQNLEHIDFLFEINGLDMLSRMHNYEEVDDDGTGETMYCHGYRGLLSEWPLGEHEIKYALTMDEAISDGWDDYPADEIAWEFVVNVSQAVQMPGIPVSVTVSLNTNCRQGPGKAYEIIGGLQIGEVAEVIGIYPNADYWIIEDPNNGRECWLWGEYAEVIGDTSQLQPYCPPLLPTATFTPTPDPNGVNAICFCNDTGDFISAIRLFNDDTDEWLGEYGFNGFGSGFCSCFPTDKSYPFGDYALEYKICDDGEACNNLGDSYTQSFDLYKNGQYIEINP
jgi:hypothetical protein